VHYYTIRFGPPHRVLAMLAAGALLLTLASCRADTTSSTKGAHLEIATLFAVSGTDAATQLPAQYGVDLAVSQAHLPDDYTVSVVHENHASAPDTSSLGATYAHIVSVLVQGVVSNARVVGVIGPFNSAIAEVTMPITNGAGLSVISPATTNPCLTLQQYALGCAFTWSKLHPSGHPSRYFRTVANDVEQGQLAAYVASHTLGAKTAAVIDDESDYGISLANAFSAAFTSYGGGVTRVSDGTAQFNFCFGVSTILAANPDLVYYSGTTSGGGALLKRCLVTDGYTKPLLGADGIANDPAWLSSAEAGADNTYGTVAAPDVSALTSRRAQAFDSAYEAYVAGRPDPTLTPYSVMAYDATNTLIQALSRAIEQGTGRSLAYFRAQTGQYLASPGFNYDGIAGVISFDENGDNAGQRIFSVYAVRSASSSSSHWSLFQLVQCSGSAELSCHELLHL
jgi:branched-chain amino acid transport system substrate-binding protein